MILPSITESELDEMTKQCVRSASLTEVKKTTIVTSASSPPAEDSPMSPTADTLDSTVVGNVATSDICPPTHNHDVVRDTAGDALDGMRDTAASTETAATVSHPVNSTASAPANVHMADVSVNIESAQCNDRAQAEGHTTTTSSTSAPDDMSVDAREDPPAGTSATPLVLARMTTDVVDAPASANDPAPCGSEDSGGNGTLQSHEPRALEHESVSVPESESQSSAPEFALSDGQKDNGEATEDAQAVVVSPVGVPDDGGGDPAYCGVCGRPELPYDPVWRCECGRAYHDECVAAPWASFYAIEGAVWYGACPSCKEVCMTRNIRQRRCDSG